MRGEKITNIYVIDSIEYEFEELSKEQNEYIKPLIDLEKYDKFRNYILFEEGDDLEGTIKIYFPSLIMECYDEFGVKLK